MRALLPGDVAETLDGLRVDSTPAELGDGIAGCDFDFARLQGEDSRTGCPFVVGGDRPGNVGQFRSGEDAVSTVKAESLETPGVVRGGSGFCLRKLANGEDGMLKTGC